MRAECSFTLVAYGGTSDRYTRCAWAGGTFFCCLRKVPPAHWSGFKLELFGLDPGGSLGMTDSCGTVTHPNPAPLLPG
jgi:hypothetical protein